MSESANNDIEQPQSISRKDGWVPLCERDHLSFIHIMGITVGTLAATLLFNILYTLFTPLVVKLKISQVGRTMILFSGGIIGFFINPFAGVVSDSLMFRWGRRRIFMVVGGLCVVLGLVVMMYCVEIGEYLSKTHTLQAQQGVMIAALEFVMIAGNFIQTPARTLCSDVTSMKQQVLVSSCVTVYSGFGGIFSNLVGGLELYKYTSLSQESFILVVGLAVVAVSLTTTIIVTPEEPLRTKPQSVNPFLQIVYAFKTMPLPILRVSISYFFAQIACYQIGVQQTDFMGRTIEGGNNAIDAGQELIDRYQKGVSWAMMCNVMNYGVQFLYSFAHPYFCGLIGMKWVFVSLMAIVGVMYLLFLFVRNKIAYLFINIPVGLATVAYLAIPQAITSLCVPTEKLGAFIGALQCFGNVGSQISNFLIGMGGSELWPGQPGKLVGVSCAFAFIASIVGLSIIVPDTNNNDNNLDDMSSEDADEKMNLEKSYDDDGHSSDTESSRSNSNSNSNSSSSKNSD